MNDPLRIGTRGSKLALVQANQVLTLLKAAHPDDPVIQNASLVTITTTGDRITDRPLADIGGKGLFAKEIEAALLSKEIDIAVHSLKDMESTFPPGLKIGAILEREDPRDVFLSYKVPGLMNLETGAIVGTCAPRRVAQVLYLRPDLKCVSIRGNVDTRITKLQEGSYDAIILALAGLRRLERESEVTSIFPITKFLPAVGQGALALECREKDTRTEGYLAPLNHPETHLCTTAERAMLAALGGNCHTPIAGHAILHKGILKLEGMVGSITGMPLFRVTAEGRDPVPLGQKVARRLKEKMGGF